MARQILQAGHPQLTITTSSYGRTRVVQRVRCPGGGVMVQRRGWIRVIHGEPRGGSHG
jgi:hypothetical protein